MDQQACSLSVASVFLGSSTASAVEQLKQQVPTPTLVLARYATTGVSGTAVPPINQRCWVCCSASTSEDIIYGVAGDPTAAEAARVRGGRTPAPGAAATPAVVRSELLVPVQVQRTSMCTSWECRKGARRAPADINVLACLFVQLLWTPPHVALHP